MTPQEFLEKAAAAARAAGHIFPEHAACEAALESAWGRSMLAEKANNLFGQKQSHPPAGATLSLPTREFLHGSWVMTPAQWMVFPSWEACFAERMMVLRRLENAYPHYRAALSATTGEQFIAQLSKSWSTDPERAEKVLSVYREHFAAHAAVLQSA